MPEQCRIFCNTWREAGKEKKILGRADAWEEVLLEPEVGPEAKDLKDLSTLATASRTFAYSLSAKWATKYAINCFFEAGSFSLSVQTMAS